MKISQCMIVKNEEDNLAKSLGNLQSIVYEQIVIDTGSTDNTVKTAESLGAKVYHFEWINDFAAAKNFAIDQASGDWIIFIDADEYFDKDKVHLIPKIILNAKKSKSTIVRLDLINLDGHQKVISKSYQDRIFINRKDVRYHGKIHEQIMSKRSDFGAYYVSTLPIWHNGYSKENVTKKNKGQRNYELIQKELETSPENAQLYNYLAESNIWLGEREEALKNYEKAFHIGKKEKDVSITIVGSIHGLLKRYVEDGCNLNDALEIFSEAILVIPNDPDIYFYMAQIYQIKENIIESIECFEKSIILSTDNQGRFYNSSITKIIEMQKILLHLYLNIKDINNAIRKSVFLLEHDKYDFNILLIFVNILLTKEEPKNIAEYLAKTYNLDNFKDRYLLLKAAEQCNSQLLKEKFWTYFSEDERKKLLSKLELPK